MSSTIQSTDESPILFFEIQSGVTQYPRRPVTRGRFLLGSGDACHMRLGGDDIPPIHSMIIAENGTTVEIERLSTGPALCVNGEEVESVTLQDGDEVAIGRIVFTARFAAEAVQAVSEQVDLLADVELTPTEIQELDELKSLKQLSVVEIIDHLEANMNLVEQHEVGIQTGLESLRFEAVVSGADDDELQPIEHPFRVAVETEPAVDSDSESVTEQLTPEDLERLIEHLSLVTAQLDERTKRVQEREAAYTVAADELLDQQSQLRAQIELLHKQVVEQTPMDRPAPRKSA